MWRIPHKSTNQDGVQVGPTLADMEQHDDGSVDTLVPANRALILMIGEEDSKNNVKKVRDFLLLKAKQKTRRKPRRVL